MFDWATMRLTWEPRMLSILRIMVGLLYLEHGLGKIFNFPAAPDHRAYVLFTLVPGLAGLLELVGGALIALGLFTRAVAFILAGEMAFAYFMSMLRTAFSRCSTAVTRQSSIVSFSSISSWWARACGALISCGHPEPGTGSDRAIGARPASSN